MPPAPIACPPPSCHLLPALMPPALPDCAHQMAPAGRGETRRPPRSPAVAQHGGWGQQAGCSASKSQCPPLPPSPPPFFLSCPEEGTPHTSPPPPPPTHMHAHTDTDMQTHTHTHTQRRPPVRAASQLGTARLSRVKVAKHFGALMHVGSQKKKPVGRYLLAQDGQ